MRKRVNICWTIPLDAGQDCCHVVRRAPTVLQNIQTQLSSSVHIWVELLTNEFYAWRLVWVLLFEVHHQTECSILKGSIRRPNNNCIPGEVISLAEV